MPHKHVELNNDCDIITGERHSNSKVEELKQLVVNLDLHVSWRVQHPEDKEYTWSRNHPFTSRRIYYAFVSTSLLSNLQHCEIISFAHSDHRAVQLGIAFRKFKREPSYWK